MRRYLSIVIDCKNNLIRTRHWQVKSSNGIVTAMCADGLRYGRFKNGELFTFLFADIIHYNLK